MSVAKPGYQRSAQLNPSPRGAMLRNKETQKRGNVLSQLEARIKRKARNES